MHHTLLSISFHGEQYKFLEYTENVVLAKKQKTKNKEDCCYLFGTENEKSVVFFLFIFNERENLAFEFLECTFKFC